ncbi:RagB/SusD family nutrient uptake outer membrane protein [Maribellus comscasis]|uniref:RagB/SusD family nutrient uptake outer membrane protein n=1 Tax=Maribellus comscasis TaxID=2681766 RepID=A0A6I6K0Q5_9BACT|nr:RagB/SusD family nutrient uptake outer membrane protein [Maribellus comscasis]QGY43474.1 RagB/SusD family nutrient uptake outer membrane protein [Maribellus comscasis]
MKYKLKNDIALRFTMLLVIFLIALGGCTEFLEEVPTDDLTTSADLTSIEYKEPFTIGPYRRLQNWTSGAGDWGNNIPSTMEYLTGGAYTDEPHVQFNKYATNQVTGSLLDVYNNPWYYWYSGVQDCNLSIQQLPLIDMSESELNEALGEVRTLRAFYYFCIVRYWGDAILVTEPITDVWETELPRTSLKTIYDEVIIPDLEFAVQNLSAGRSTDGRVTQDVARAILADVYMTVAGYPYQEVATNPGTDWCGTGAWSMTEYPVASGLEFLQKAQTQLNALYNNVYTLGTYDDLRDPAMDNLGEAIFQVQFDAQLGGNGLLQPSLPLLSAITPSEENGTFTPWVGYYNSYSDDDLRKQERQFFFTYDYLYSNPSERVDFDVPYLYKQYVEAAVKSTDGSGLNWSHYRYGDILLMLTEVNWALKELGQSVSDNDIIKGINEIRERALLPAYTASEVGLKEILAERAYELIFENKMLWDQRRTRKCVVYGDGEISAIQNFVGHQPAIFNFAFAPMHLLSPIPGNEIARNGLSQQNSGYLPTQN